MVIADALLVTHAVSLMVTCRGDVAEVGAGDVVGEVVLTVASKVVSATSGVVVDITVGARVTGLEAMGLSFGRKQERE